MHYYQKLHHKSSKGILKSISSKFHAIGIIISHVINFFLISDIWAHSALVYTCMLYCFYSFSFLDRRTYIPVVQYVNLRLMIFWILSKKAWKFTLTLPSFMKELSAFYGIKYNEELFGLPLPPQVMGFNIQTYYLSKLSSYFYFIYLFKDLFW